MTVVEPTLIPSNEKFRDQAEPPELATPDFADTRENRELVGKVYALFQKARDHRRPLIARWDRCYRMTFNRYWTRSRPSFLPTPQLPEILPIVRSLLGFQFDQRITHVVAPALVPGVGGEAWFAERATDLETTLSATWHVNAEEREWNLAGWDGWVYGTGIMKTAWEAQLAGGLGDAMSRRIDPRCFYPDPMATNEHDGDFYIEAKEMTVQELDRRFPGCYELFADGGSVFVDTDKAPTQIDLAGGDGRSRVTGNPGAISPATVPSYFERGSSRMRDDGPVPTVTVIECWVREHTFADVTDERTGKKAKVAVESWRVVVVAGQHVLMNEPAKNLWSHGQHPYSRYCPLEIGEFWGPSLVEALIPSQQSINRILAALQQNVELTGNPIWKDTPQSGSTRTPTINRPGQRVTVGAGDAGQNVGWENPPSLNPGMLELLKYHLARMEAISGVTAMQKGQVPGGRNAQGTVESVQESAFVTIRAAQRNLEYAMRDAGYKKAELICEFYTKPRMVAIAGAGGERTSIMLGALHFHLPSSEGSVPMKYQLLIDAGSRRHTARQIMEERAIQMFTLGLLPPTDTLEAINWPKAREVGQKVEEQMAAAAAAAGPDQRTKARA